MRTPLALFVALVAGAFSVGRAQCTPAVQKLLTDQKYDDARAEVQSLVKKNAADDVALQCMGRVYFAMDKSNEAIDWFEKAIKANEKVASHHLWLANSLGDQAGHTNKLKLPFLARRIKSEFDRAAQLDPSSIDARHGLIQFYSQAPGVMGGSMDKAKEQAIEIEKLNAMRGHIEMAALLEREKDLPGAERELTAALGAAPDSNQAYNTLGNFYRRQKRYADAVTVYERLLKAKPDAQGAHLNIGLILAQSGNRSTVPSMRSSNGSPTRPRTLRSRTSVLRTTHSVSSTNIRERPQPRKRSTRRRSRSIRGTKRRKRPWLPSNNAVVLPGSALARHRDHFAETIRRMAPIDLHRELGVIRASFVDSRHDDVVLVHRGPDVARQHADVHADVAFGLRLHRVV